MARQTSRRTPSRAEVRGGHSHMRTTSGRPRGRARGRMPRVAWQPPEAALQIDRRSGGPRQRGRVAVLRVRPETHPAAETRPWPESAARCRARLPESSAPPRRARAPFAWRVGCQSHSALQERGGGGDASSGLGASGASFQLLCHLLVGCGRGSGQMPGPAVRIDLAISCLCQCAVHAPPLIGRRRPVHGGANERMTERHRLLDREQPIRRISRPSLDPEAPGCTPDHQRIARPARQQRRATTAAHRPKALRHDAESSPPAWSATPAAGRPATRNRRQAAPP